jgi:hypothetical protein
MEDIFKNKYLKYKKKYLSLKNQTGGGSIRADECPCAEDAGGNTCYIKDEDIVSSECGPVTQGYSLDPRTFFSGKYYRDCDPRYDVHCPNPEISKEMIAARNKFEDEKEIEREAEIAAEDARLEAARAAYANSPEKKERDRETKRIQDEYKQSIENTYRGRVLLSKWFGGQDDYRGPNYKLSNSALLDSAQLFSLGGNGKYNRPMLGRLPKNKLKQPDNIKIQLMSEAATEILRSEDNFRQGKKSRELNWAYTVLDDNYNKGF